MIFWLRIKSEERPSEVIHTHCPGFLAIIERAQMGDLQLHGEKMPLDLLAGEADIAQSRAGDAIEYFSVRHKADAIAS